MSVLGVTELANVSASRKFGEPPTFQRKWVVEVDNPATPLSAMLSAVGVNALDSHPEASYCRAMTANGTNYNGSRWHYEITWDYELPKQANPDPNPLARPDIWKWTTGGLSVPALYYYDGDDLESLINTAGDFFEGATTDISTLQASISSNRPTFDYGLATTVTNSVNSDAFLGAAQYTWKCSGISGQPAVEVVNEQEIRYWQIEVTLEYRPDGWPLQLPNVGWNYLEGGTKKRVWVRDPDTLERIPSSNPQPLDANGNIQAGAPDILSRRVHRAVEFGSYFGTPPQP